VLRYAGYAFDAESGMYYCSARHYDPETMQFISKDPAKDDGEESAYQYCGGDPVEKTDSTGEYAMKFKWPEGYTKSSSSTYLIKVLRRNAGYAFKQRFLKLTSLISWFKSRVNHNRPWDLKRSPSSGVGSKSAWLLRVRISPEQYGNIHYGYVGRAAGFPLIVLRGGSVYANGRNYVGLPQEMFSDQPMIALGYRLAAVFGISVRTASRVDRFEK
jgi:RHS repeat-associated protein